MKEITEWADSCTSMYVWDYDESKKVLAKVICICPGKEWPVVTLTPGATEVRLFKHAAMPESRRMTNRELSKWLREDNNRERKNTSTEVIDTYHSYGEYTADDPVSDLVVIREGDEEWHEPLKEEQE